MQLDCSNFDIVLFVQDIKLYIFIWLYNRTKSEELQDIYILRCIKRKNTLQRPLQGFKSIFTNKSHSGYTGLEPIR